MLEPETDDVVGAADEQVIPDYFVAQDGRVFTFTEALHRRAKEFGLRGISQAELDAMVAAERAAEQKAEQVDAGQTEDEQTAQEDKPAAKAPTRKRPASKTDGTWE